MSGVADPSGDRLVIGLGVSSSATADAVLRGLHRWLLDDGRTVEPGLLVELRTLDRLVDHPVVVEVARTLDLPVVGYPADTLAREAVTEPSARALAETGTPSVAEAACLVGGCVPLLRRLAVGGATLAVSRQIDLRHHGDDEARTAGVVVDLAVNVAVTRPPALVREALAACLDSIAAYPDDRPATEAVAAHLGVDPACVLLTNGGAQGFSLVAHARPWRHAVVVHPQFTEPEAALRAAGARVHRHLLPPPFVLEPRRLTDTAPGADLVVVGNPTNPTSVLHPAGAVLACRPREGVLLVDEAFVDTSADPQQSVLRDAARVDSRVVVLRSLTKTFGLAGLRIGIAVGDPAVISRLRELAPPWSVSTPALAAAVAVATPAGDAFCTAQRARLLANAHHLAEGLRAGGLSVLEPQAPFVLATGPAVPALRDHLLTSGIATRGCASFPGLGPEWVRLAARDPEVVDPVLDLVRRSGAGRPGGSPGEAGRCGTTTRPAPPADRTTSKERP